MNKLKLISTYLVVRIIAVSTVRHYLAIGALALLILIPVSTRAQLNGNNLKGDLGLASGSQAPPGAYAGFLYYRYHSDRLNNRDGNQVNNTASMTLAAGVPIFNAVTKKKFLGANVGFMAVFPIVNTMTEIATLASNPSPALGDIYFQPINLGWHLKKADVTAAYGVFAPTGKYTAGASDNTGLGMWGHELSVGTTVYPDEKKNWNLSMTGAVELHTKKKNSNGAQVGNILTLEGGVGRKFLGGGINTGLVYYAQWKLSDDKFGLLLPRLLVQGRNSSAAFGPEFTMALASKKKGKVYGFVTARYYWEAYSRVATQGNAFVAQIIFPLQPIKLGPPPPGN